MSKTKEELNAIKEKVEAVNEKLQELTPEEIAQVTGGMGFVYVQSVLEPPSLRPRAKIM